jgi:hypothetical protein
MRATSDAVVFLTGLPIAGLLIVQGTAVGRVGEVLAGLVIAAILGGPSLVGSLVARLRGTGRDER